MLGYILFSENIRNVLGIIFLFWGRGWKGVEMLHKWYLQSLPFGFATDEALLINFCDYTMKQ